ncbi:hypothetical protein CB1_002050001 [Camelus ferus]|nr:hypothetical protein CB1_002050001 [Camelus ferus]
MAPSGSSVVPVAVLLLLLWGVPWTHGRRSDVRVITDKNWKELLEGEWMIEFYAPWCPACQNLQPEWESFAEWGEDLEVNIAKVDVTEQPESSQPLKKVEEEQEADEEDVSEEEAESKEGTDKDFAQNAIRQRSVGPSLATDKS